MIVRFWSTVKIYPLRPAGFFSYIALMTLPRFILELDMKAGLKTELADPEMLNQLKNVLRFKAGDKIIIADGNLREATAEIVSLNKKSATIRILEIKKNNNEPSIYTHLYCAILKRENFDLAVQKVTETGISEITPIITKRTVKLNFKRDRLNKITREAAEQSGRGRVPKLNDPIDFISALTTAAAVNELNIFLEPKAEIIAPNFFRAQQTTKLGIFIGPEGGWDVEELKSATDAEFRILSLSRLILRAETAAIVSSYLMANFLQ